MSRFASTTSVSEKRTRIEIEETLERYEGTSFGYFKEGNLASIQFDLEHRRMHFLLTLPDPQSREFTHTAERGLERTKAQATAAYEQAVRQRWRALLLVIKAKLEAVDAGITTLEQEFLANIVLPSGQTFGEWATSQLDEIASTKNMPPLLAAPGHLRTS